MIDCTQAEALIAQRIDATASAADERALAAHVAGCAACAAQLEAEIALDALLIARLGRIEAPPSLAPRVRERIAAVAPAPAGAGWIADALNGVGFLAAIAWVAAMGQGLSVAGIAVGTAVLVASLYPLLVSVLIGDTGPANAGPVRGTSGLSR